MFFSIYMGLFLDPFTSYQDFPMITQAQLAFKKGKIGASQAAAALGLSPYQTPANFYNELIGNIEREDIGAKGRIGNAMEPVIIQEYEIVMGVKVIPSPDTLIHPKYPWMICHLDGKIPEFKKILEIKNVGWTVAHRWGPDADPDGVPMDVMIQCTHQAILADVSRVDVAAFFGGNELRVYPLEITDAAKEGLMTGLLNFWENHVVKRIQPEFGPQDVALLQKLFADPKNEEVVQVEDTETAVLFQDFRNLKTSIKDAEKKANLMKIHIMDFMGDAGSLMRGDDMEFTWKKSKDGKKVNWEGVCSDMDSYLEEKEEFFLVDQLCDFVDQNTKKKTGSRVFLDKLK